MTRKAPPAKLEAQPVVDPPETAPELLLQCPAELSPLARKEWDRLLPDLLRTVKLKNIDRGLLAVHCESIAMWLDAVANIQKYGPVMKSPSGYPVQSPYVAIANQQVVQIIKTGTELGLSPVSRTRVPQIRDDVAFGGRVGLSSNGENLRLACFGQCFNMHEVMRAPRSECRKPNCVLLLSGVTLGRGHRRSSKWVWLRRKKRALTKYLLVRPCA